MREAAGHVAAARVTGAGVAGAGAAIAEAERPAVTPFVDDAIAVVIEPVAHLYVIVAQRAAAARRLVVFAGVGVVAVAREPDHEHLISAPIAVVVETVASLDGRADALLAATPLPPDTRLKPELADTDSATADGRDLVEAVAPLVRGAVAIVVETVTRLLGWADGAHAGLPVAIHAILHTELTCPDRLATDASRPFDALAVLVDPPVAVVVPAIAALVVGAARLPDLGRWGDARPASGEHHEDRRREPSHPPIIASARELFGGRRDPANALPAVAERSPGPRAGGAVTSDLALSEEGVSHCAFSAGGGFADLCPACRFASVRDRHSARLLLADELDELPAGPQVSLALAYGWPPA